MTRRFQFNLRALLVALTVFAVLLAAVSHRAREQRETVMAFKAMGWYVYYDWQRPFGEMPGPVLLRRIVGDEYFQEVVLVTFLRGTELDARRTEESIRLLRKCPKLVLVTFWPMIPKRSWDALVESLPQCMVMPHMFP